MYCRKTISYFITFALFFSFCFMIFYGSAIDSLQKISNENLMNKVIYIDAGHGGKDNGASENDVFEDEINLKISLYLAEKFINSGARVLMSRTADYDLSSLYKKNKKREDLKNRVKYINYSRPDIFISIHLNTYSSNTVYGGQVFYQNSDKSEELASYIQIQMNELTNASKNIKKGDYYLLNNTTPVGVLIECGFLSNKEERILLNSDAYQRKIAKRIMIGVSNYFLSKKY